MEKPILSKTKQMKGKKDKGKEALGILVVVNKKVLKKVYKLYYEKYIKYFPKVFSERWSED